MDGEHHYATLHAKVKDVKVKNQIKDILKGLEIDHPTVELETEDEDCEDK